MPHSLRHVVPVLLALCWTAPARAQTFWTPIASPTTRYLRSLCFTDSLYGWASGNTGTLIKTTDGGESWRSLNPGITNDIVDVFMLDRTTGWALAHDLSGSTFWTNILATTDGGETWSSESYPEPDVILNSIRFFDSQHGWVAGESAVLTSTDDGGHTWTSAVLDSLPPPLGDLRRMQFYSPHYGYAVGGRFDLTGVIWRTSNGGSLWSARVIAPEPINDVHYFDSLLVIGLTGDYDYGSGLVRTTDGGVHWDYTNLGIWGDARALSFRTPTEGWAPLGFAGTCMVTRDGGQTWQSMHTPDTTAMVDIHFIDSTRGFMIGSGGTILRYVPQEPTTRTVNVREGWNLVALPLMVGDRRPVGVFPTAISPAFGFLPGTGYFEEDSLSPGRGYWLKFGNPDSISLAGTLFLSDTIDLEVGWNMIGAMSGEVDTATVITVPPGIRSSNFYGYEGAYAIASMLTPGRGYWVKSTAPGRMVLGGTR